MIQHWPQVIRNETAVWHDINYYLYLKICRFKFDDIPFPFHQYYKKNNGQTIENFSLRETTLDHGLNRHGCSPATENFLSSIFASVEEFMFTPRVFYSDSDSPVAMYPHGLARQEFTVTAISSIAEGYWQSSSKNYESFSNRPSGISCYQSHQL